MSGALAALAAGSAIAGGISGLINNERNYRLQVENLDYQKALQQQIFDREDTAIQRRKSDLEAAGFNPYLAMNSNGANSGAVVSTQAPQSNADFGFIAGSVGSALDMVRSLEQLKQDKLYTEYMNLKNIEASNNLFSEWAYNNGVDGHEYWKIFDSRKPENSFSAVKESALGWMRRAESYRNSMFGYQSVPKLFEQLGYQSDIMKVQRDFALSDKLEQYTIDLIDRLIGGSNSSRGWYDSYNKNHQPMKKQDYYERSFRDINGVYHRSRSYR